MEERITTIMKSLKCSREEALEIIADDEAIDHGEEMWFDKAMEYFLQIWERMQHNGYYTDYIFQTVGYTALPLGTAETKVTDPGFENGFFYVDVADGLILGEDYAYEYTYKGTTYIYDDAEAAAP